jgi:hypothetical protein
MYKYINNGTTLFRRLQDREAEDASKDRTLVEANILEEAYNSMS